jgi:LysM repeat protein
MFDIRRYVRNTSPRAALPAEAPPAGSLEEDPVSTISITPARGIAPARATSPRAASPRLRLTTRGRVVLGTLAAAPLVAGLVFASVTAPASAGNEQGTTSFATVTVGAGESLWSIAERIAPQSDPREVIGELQRLNGLEDSAVAAGQTIAIPAQYAH